MVVLRAALVSLLTAITACSVGEVPIGTTTDGGARDAGADAGAATGHDGGADAGGTGMGPGQSFQTIVKPIVAPCLSCHNGGQPPNLTSYSTLAPSYITKPGAACLLVNKGAHEGPALTATEQTTIASWVDSLP